MKRRPHLHIESLKPAYSDSECGTKRSPTPDFAPNKHASPTSDIEVMSSALKPKTLSPEEFQAQQKDDVERIASETENQQSAQQSSTSALQQLPAQPQHQKRPSFLFPFPRRAKLRSRAAASSLSSAASDQMSVASGCTNGGGGSVLGFGLGASTSFVSLKSLPRFLTGRGAPSASSLALAAEHKARQRMKLIAIRLKKFSRERKAAKTLTVSIF